MNILLEQFDSSGDRILNFQEFTVSTLLEARGDTHSFSHLQQILEELQGSGWDIKNQEANDDLGATDLKEMFIEADRERRSSGSIVVPKRVRKGSINSLN